MTLKAEVLFILLVLVIALAYGAFDWWQRERRREEFRRQVREAKRIWDGEDE